MSDVIGKCYICKKDVTEHEVRQLNTVRFCALWPGDHLCCAEHPGVIEDYESLMKTAGAAPQTGDTKNGNAKDSG